MPRPRSRHPHRPWAITHVPRHIMEEEGRRKTATQLWQLTQLWVPAGVHTAHIAHTRAFASSALLPNKLLPSDRIMLSPSPLRLFLRLPPGPSAAEDALPSAARSRSLLARRALISALIARARA